MKQHSIRRTLTVRLLIGLAGLSIGAALITFHAARAALSRQFDATLLAKARAIAVLVKQERTRSGLEMEFEYEPGALPEFERTEKPEYFQVYLPNRESFARSKSLQNEDLPVTALAGDRLFDPTNSKIAFSDFELPFTPEPQRIAIYPFVPIVENEPYDPEKAAPPPRTVVAVSQSREELDSMLGLLASIFACGALLTPLVGALLIAFTVRRSLVPLEKLSTQVEAIEAESLSSRIDLGAPPAEIAPVQEKLNQLLQRLQESFEREKRFTSNVSHELRTPLAEIRTAVEVASRWPEDNALHSASCTDAIAAVDHIKALVSRLLLLARAQAGVLPPIASGQVNLSDMTTAVLQPLRDRAVDREIALTVRAPEQPVIVLSDATSLQTIIRNLCENAVEHAPPGNPVEIVIKANQLQAIWSIQNAAPELKQDDILHLFEPFWRKDASRTGDSHVGLGLSLVQSLAEQCDAEITTSLTDDAIRFSISVTAATITSPLYDQQHQLTGEMKYSD